MTETAEVLDPQGFLPEPEELRTDDPAAMRPPDPAPPAGETSPDEPVVAELAGLDQSRRQEWVARVRGEQRLPGALRERLAQAVEQSAEIDGLSEPRLTLSQVAGVLADAVPSLLALDGGPQIAAHPGGEAFFRSGQLGDDEAARLASEQLARAGFDRHV